MPPTHQVRYRMNPIDVAIVKQNLDKLLTTWFIEPIKETTWLFPIVFVPKNNGNMRICVDFWNLNATMLKDPHPLLFIDEVLDQVMGHEDISICDRCLGYYQIKIYKEDQCHTALIIEWGMFSWINMAFWLTKTPSTFQRGVPKYIFHFFLDDFSIFNDMETHLNRIWNYFIKCCESGSNLN